MANEINYDAMRIKLEFLFRTLKMSERVMDGISLPYVQQNENIGIISTAGLYILYMHRIDGAFILTQTEEQNARNVACVIAEEFNSLRSKINRECSGLPITITLGRTEGMIHEGMDKIIEVVKYVIEGTEVSHG